MLYEVIKENILIGEEMIYTGKVKFKKMDIIDPLYLTTKSAEEIERLGFSETFSRDWICDVKLKELYSEFAYELNNKKEIIKAIDMQLEIHIANLENENKASESSKKAKSAWEESTRKLSCDLAGFDLMVDNEVFHFELGCDCYYGIINSFSFAKRKKGFIILLNLGDISNRNEYISNLKRLFK